MIQIDIASADEMRRLGARLAAVLLAQRNAPLIVGLEGELGAGKTTLVSGLLASLGIAGAIRSPTYTLIEAYDARDATLHHIDLYRLVDPSELEPLGLRDLLVPGAILLIEWPSRAGDALPSADLKIQIAYQAGEPARRRVRIAANTQKGDNVLAALVAAKPEFSRISP